MAGFRLNTSRSGASETRRRFSRAVQHVESRQWAVVQRAALLAERELKLTIARRRHMPLAKLTKLITGRSRPLNRSGALLGSVTTTLDKPRKAAFVGVHRTARSRDGTSLVNVALIQEFGTGPYMIRVSDAMRRFFWAMFFKTAGAIKPISSNKSWIAHPGVPARPFLRPTIERIRPKLKEVLVRVFTEDGGPI